MGYPIETTAGGFESVNAPCDKCGVVGLWLYERPHMIDGDLRWSPVLCDGCRFVLPATNAAEDFWGAVKNVALTLLVAVVVALVIFFAFIRPAHAQGLGSPLGDPCAPGYDADAGVPLRTAALPDGGTEDVPAAICAGQRAPAHGVFLTVRQAAALAGERAGSKARIAALEHSVEQADTTTPALAGLVSGALTVAVAVWCRGHDCNPLHIGKK